MNKSSSSLPLRDCISSDPSECAVFAVDLLSQPHRGHWLDIDPLIYLKSSRSLVLADPDDIVLIAGETDKGYIEWLRSVSFGTTRIVEFRSKDSSRPLSEMVLQDPSLVEEQLKKVGKKPVYVPFYCSKKDELAAEKLGAALFGCSEETTLRYFNKENFKKICKDLGLPTVASTAASGDENSLTKEELADVVEALLGNYKSLIVRGTVGSAGDSVYRVESENLQDVLESIRESHSPKFLVEPLLKVIASPNDQWCINRNGDMQFIGLSAQLFKGLSHVGNLYGEFFSPRVIDKIATYSFKIAERMRADGYKGVFGVDYIVCDEGIFPIENNARLNGSSFAFGILDRIQEKVKERLCWKFFKASSNAKDFTTLAAILDPLLFSPGKVNSVFPFDCDALSKNGSFACLLVAEDIYHLEYLEGALSEAGIKRV